jgi:hypothetical protein
VSPIRSPVEYSATAGGTGKAWQSGVLQQEVMAALVPPWKKPIDQDNNVRMDVAFGHLLGGVAHSQSG